MKKNTMYIGTILSTLLISNQAYAIDSTNNDSTKKEDVSLPSTNEKSIIDDSDKKLDTNNPSIDNSKDSLSENKKDKTEESSDDNSNKFELHEKKSWEEIDESEKQDIPKEDNLEHDYINPVRTPNLSPYRSSVQLRLDYGDYKGENKSLRKSYGTGTVIGDNYVLTAGHVIAADGRGSIATGGKVVSGIKDKNGNYITFEIEKVIPFPKWLTADKFSERFDYDIGLVKVKPNSEGKTIGEVLGIINVNKSNTDNIGEKVISAGYPVYYLEEYKFTQWYKKGKVVEADEYYYNTDFYTAGGNSGGGLINSKNELIGVLSRGTIDNSIYMRMRPLFLNWLEENGVKLTATPQVEQEKNKKPDAKQDQSKDNNPNKNKDEKSTDNKLDNKKDGKSTESNSTGKGSNVTQIKNDGKSNNVENNKTKKNLSNTGQTTTVAYGILGVALCLTSAMLFRRLKK